MSTTLPAAAELAPLLGVLQAHPQFQKLLDLLGRQRSVTCRGVIRAARACLAAGLRHNLEGPILWVAPSADHAERLSADLGVLLPDTEVLLFPERETPEEGAADPLRMAVLAALHMGRSPLVVAPVKALLQTTVRAEQLQRGRILLKRGDRVDLGTLVAILAADGYRRVPMVERRGEFSVRGGILDIFPVTGDPVRLELFGDELESMRRFDRDTQRSVEAVEQVVLLPAREEGGSSLADYLPPGSLACLEEPSQLKLHALEWAQEEGGSTFSPDLEQLLARQRRLLLTTWEEVEGLEMPFEVQPVLPERIEGLLKALPAWLAEHHRVVILTRQHRRLQEILEDAGHPPGTNPVLLPGSLTEGLRLRLPDGAWLEVLTDHEIVGTPRRRRPTRQVDRGSLIHLDELTPGDTVVHLQHGIGRYQGVKSLEIQGIKRDFLQLEYARGDKLYVPVEQLDLVQKYQGLEDRGPSLSRLGGQEWARTRRKVRQAAQEIAQELLRLYAARETAQGHAFPPDSPWQEEMEEAFPWQETPDQHRAIEEVKGDMEKPRPMDRLVCGDVGYGKTEVALRAAFKAAMESKQVAVLVPTTVLAHQHYQSFRERLAPFPVRVELLSRFRSAREQRQVVEGLSRGEVDVVIGTHRLLSADVRFHDLGLLVIDEEHRFGVRHKEAIKKMRQNVDVLTLSATPIPRTLHMALSGVRDMSLIQTPPEDRQPIKTYLFESHPDIIRAAITRELAREGQVYFVHNRVQGIERLAQDLRRLVPQARVAVAHGQMDEDRLEQVMMEFYEGEHDVLVCTTIIESGLDIPNVNTILINNAHTFGLAQLYQLRGRVGRSAQQAYCYLLYPPTRQLTEEAEKRLETIKDFTHLGAGFQIALKDLEIRGAGDLLGAEQSGHVAAVGFELYCQMLSEAVAELRGEPVEEPPPSPVLEIPVPAVLPDSYIEESRQKVALYKRLAGVRRREELEAIAEELRDRYGPLPPQARNLLALVDIKLKCLELEIPAIRVREGRMMILLPFYQTRQSATPDRAGRGSGEVFRLFHKNKLWEATGWQSKYEQKALIFEGLYGRAAGSVTYPPPEEMLAKIGAVLRLLSDWQA
ncbi:MAG TPA: transcription-repair coupling factor [Candidatus Nitrosotenuis sp.]|jgi:transcription-repair coupling factor (superfamily II helicase)|nr:transcription-repair coupling factor [Candidatus Nitrosotenuis sp.]